jgi:hypothetical protein
MLVQQQEQEPSAMDKSGAKQACAAASIFLFSNFTGDSNIQVK